MAQTEMATWFSRIAVAVQRDAKKAGVLVILLAALGFTWFKSSGGGKPSRATAAGVSSRVATGKNATSAQVRSVTVNPYLQKWSEQPLSPITRNLFSVRLEYFPLEAPRSGSSVREGADEGFWAKLEKSLILQADQRDKRVNQIANYKAEAAQLRLQSTMMGPQPKALVNGELVGEGDVIASFRVVKIEARRIMIEREGIRLEIQMK